MPDVWCLQVPLVTTICKITWFHVEFYTAESWTYILSTKFVTSRLGASGVNCDIPLDTLKACDKKDTLDNKVFVKKHALMIRDRMLMRVPKSQRSHKLKILFVYFYHFDKKRIHFNEALSILSALYSCQTSASC